MFISLTSWFRQLLLNSRFWILCCGIVASANIAGFVQFFISDSTQQIIRTEQVYGFVAMGLMYLAILASPLLKAFPDLPIKDFYFHARRAIGVLAFYYALLHVLLAFFKQLGGFAGIHYYDSKYAVAVSLGFAALSILLLMAATSFDWAIRIMTFPRWKFLHRFVYGATVAVLVHIALIGPHYAGIGFTSMLTLVGITFLLWLEGIRLIANAKKSKKGTT